jgi:ABC-2 type transport system ATP-binding protein
MSITISNLTKTYGSQKAIDGISFGAVNNEIVGFLGPNGAGKSTTMKIVTGYLKADSGEVEVDGINVNKDPLAVKKRIGYLPEGNPLYHEMYVREYLEFIAGLHQIKKGIKKRIEEVIELTGLTIESNKKTGQLSKGYKQRVGLAAALIHNPDVLILDEPTSGLDPNQIIEIRQVIKDLGKNKTVLFSSHILQEVESICDKVVIINKGIIVANDTLANLRSSDNMDRIVVVQFAEEMSESIFSSLSDIKKVEKEESSSVYRIQTTDPESVKRQILKLSLDNNLNIVSLQSKTKSLEEVFKNLTGNIQNN